jgi:uncharacterized protein (TIGR00297 family)
MTNLAYQLALGFGFAAIVGAFAWRVRALDRRGAMAAVFVGGLIFGLGGISASAVLIVFFITGTVLSRLPGGGHVRTGNEKRGRNWKQVLANGGIPAAAIVATHIPRLQMIGMHAYLGALAAATADSWSTEVGTRYGSNPRDILTWNPIDRGVSGGISGMGTIASLAGAMLIAAAAILPWAGALPTEFRLFIAVVIAGFMGAVADSLIGSAMQAKFRCSSAVARSRWRSIAIAPQSY